MNRGTLKSTQDFNKGEIVKVKKVCETIIIDEPEKPNYFIEVEGVTWYLCTNMHTVKMKMQGHDHAKRFADTMNDAIKRYYDNKNK